ncbi:MAG: Gfo/Idh/MocA family oxidoreductase [Roseiflexaceae bacterium]|nr:Gfo/Idh/MocA family oxidoreductase [Roseiflexaceae bacterium]
MTTRIACVGTGWVAGRHLEVLSRMDDLAIVAVAGREAARAAPLAQRYNAQAYGDLVQMLDDQQPDALLICTIPGNHGQAEQAALQRNIPFLVEKPLAADWQTASEIADAVEQAGLITSVAYHWRYHATVERARQFLAGRHVALVQGYWLDSTPPPAWWSIEAESGGQLVEQATHIFDLARLLVGEASQVYAASAPVEHTGGRRGDVHQASAATVRFENGAVGTFAATCLLWSQYRAGLHLFGEGFAIELGERLLVMSTPEGRQEFHSDADAFVAEDAAFIQAVRSGDRSGIRSTYADALRTHRLTTQARASAQQGLALSTSPTLF